PHRRQENVMRQGYQLAGSLVGWTLVAALVALPVSGCGKTEAPPGDPAPGESGEQAMGARGGAAASADVVAPAPSEAAAPDEAPTEPAAAPAPATPVEPVSSRDMSAEELKRLEQSPG